ncbi:unnamed protein product [Amoebophrya sp. A25]|nr:unnamed protein product [Amoebophrya sp. A25]|eukprot:GSA25T00022084001.1
MTALSAKMMWGSSDFIDAGRIPTLEGSKGYLADYGHTAKRLFEEVIEKATKAFNAARLADPQSVVGKKIVNFVPNPCPNYEMSMLHVGLTFGLGVILPGFSYVKMLQRSMMFLEMAKKVKEYVPALPAPMTAMDRDTSKLVRTGSVVTGTSLWSCAAYGNNLGASVADTVVTIKRTGEMIEAKRKDWGATKLETMIGNEYWYPVGAEVLGLLLNPLFWLILLYWAEKRRHRAELGDLEQSWNFSGRWLSWGGNGSSSWENWSGSVGLFGTGWEINGLFGGSGVVTITRCNSSPQLRSPHDRGEQSMSTVVHNTASPSNTDDDLSVKRASSVSTRRGARAASRGAAPRRGSGSSTNGSPGMSAAMRTKVKQGCVTSDGTSDLDAGSRNYLKAAVSNEKVLQLRGLTKSFNTKKANSDLTFDVHRGEIFGLLGHNGAGKTTLISQITGMIPCTSGDALVGGYSIRTQVSDVRRRVSLCPQYNPMWDIYTLEEHVAFFARLRGVPEANIETLTKEYARLLGIEEKLHTLCQELSGGQKRRLWVLCALLGDSPLIILDEPTSGMDPQARRDFWVLLKRIVREQKRSVLFSTHYLEEADLLAERKVILANGRLMAIGTSSEMKRAWGAGFWVHAMIDKAKLAARLLKVNITTSTSSPGPVNKYVSRVGRDDEAYRYQRSETTGVIAKDILKRLGAHVVGPILAAAADVGSSHSQLVRSSSTSSSSQFNVETKNPRVSDFFLAYSIPWHHVGKMARVLDALAAASQLEAYGADKEGDPVLDFTVEQTTMEEVFSLAGEAAEKQDLSQAEMDIMTQSKKRDQRLSRAPLRKRSLNWFTQFCAIWRFRFVESIQNWVQLLWLVTFIGTVLTLGKLMGKKLQDVDSLRFKNYQQVRAPEEGRIGLFSDIFHSLVTALVFPLMFSCFGMNAIWSAYYTETTQGLLRHMTLHGTSRGAFHLASFFNWIVVPTGLGWAALGIGFPTLLTDSYGSSEGPMQAFLLWIIACGCILNILTPMLFGLTGNGTLWTIFVVGTYVTALFPFICGLIIDLVVNLQMLGEMQEVLHGTQKVSPELNDWYSCQFVAQFMTMATGATYPVTFMGLGRAEWVSTVSVVFSVFVPQTAIVQGTMGLFKLILVDRMRQVMAGEKDPKNSFQILNMAKAQNPNFFMYGQVEPDQVKYFVKSDDLLRALNSAYQMEGKYHDKVLEAVVFRMRDSKGTLPPGCADMGWVTRTAWFEVLAPVYCLLFYLVIFVLSETWFLRSRIQSGAVPPEGLPPSDVRDELRDPNVLAEERRRDREQDVVDVRGAYKHFRDEYANRDHIVRRRRVGGGRDNTELVQRRGEAGLLSTQPTGWAASVTRFWSSNCRCCRQRKAAYEEASEVGGLATSEERESMLEGSGVDDRGRGRGASTSCCGCLSRGGSSSAAAEPNWATRGVTLGIPRGECFGLLGPNGAGKTTLFNLMTGDDNIGGVDAGSIWIHNTNTRRDAFKSARLRMGLAPQFDRLWSWQTGRRHLRLYAKCSGTYYKPWPKTPTWDPFVREVSEIEREKGLSATSRTNSPRDDDDDIGPLATTTTHYTTSSSITKGGSSSSRSPSNVAGGVAGDHSATKPQMSQSLLHINNSNIRGRNYTGAGLDFEDFEVDDEPEIQELLRNSQKIQMNYPSGASQATVLGKSAALVDDPLGSSRSSSTSSSSRTTTGSEVDVCDWGEERISRFLREVSLSEEDADRYVDEYSGGMRRKLSLALTLITDPELVFLDEVSAGVDIVAQRSLWNKMIHRPAGQTIVATTHSMMEADATSDRIGILVSGRLKCLGETARIKAAYGNGYHLELTLNLTKERRPIPLNVKNAVNGGSGNHHHHHHHQEDGARKAGLTDTPTSTVSADSFIGNSARGARLRRGRGGDEYGVDLQENDTIMMMGPSSTPRRAGAGGEGAGRDSSSTASGLSLATVDEAVITSLLQRDVGIAPKDVHVLEKVSFGGSRVRLVLGLGAKGVVSAEDEIEQNARRSLIKAKEQQKLFASTSGPLSPIDQDKFKAAATSSATIPSGFVDLDRHYLEQEKQMRVRQHDLERKEQLVRKKIKLSAVFAWCSEDPLHILEDYGLGEPTLEQVFLKFAREQEVLDARREEVRSEKLALNRRDFR